MAYLTDIATALPSNEINQKDMVHLGREGFQDNIAQRKFLALTHSDAVKKKYSVLPIFSKHDKRTPYSLTDFGEFMLQKRMEIFQLEAPILVETALKCLLESKTCIPSTVTDIITVSCTGLSAPSFTVDFLDKYNFSPKVKRHEINFMGCFAGVQALRQAQLICKANPKANVLILAVELCTLHFNSNPSNDNILATYLFGDGAVACYVQGEKNGTSGLTLVDFESHVIPKTQQLMQWNIGKHAFEMVLSSKIGKEIETSIEDPLQAFLHKNGLSKDEVDYAVHPGGVKILESIQKACPLSDLSSSYEVLSSCGNMSSVTIFFILEKALRNPKKNTSIYTVAFGPGLTIEQALLNYY